MRQASFWRLRNEKIWENPPSISSKMRKGRGFLKKALVTMAHGLTLHNQIMRDELLRTLMLKWDNVIALIRKIMRNDLLRIARMTFEEVVEDVGTARLLCMCARKRSGSSVQRSLVSTHMLQVCALASSYELLERSVSRNLQLFLRSLDLGCSNIHLLFRIRSTRQRLQRCTPPPRA
jgi:hypothetical protein